MNDLETVIDLLKKIHKIPDVSDLVGDITELSIDVDDTLNMKRVFVKFGFDRNNSIVWIDVEVR